LIQEAFAVAGHFKQPNINVSHADGKIRRF